MVASVINQIYNENCIVTMGRMPDDYLDLTVTSPPYDDIIQKLEIVDGQIVKSYEIKSILRDYKGYSWDIQSIARELYRVTKDGGVCVWVMNDPMVEGSESLASCYTRIIFQEAGWLTHDTMIYEKHNFSNPSTTRYHQMFEYMFVFSKGKPKTFNPIKDKKNIEAGKPGNWSKNTYRLQDGSLKERRQNINSEFGMRGNIWKYNTAYGFAGDTEAYQHPAVYPEKLAEEQIKSWSNLNDLVYDPFGGSFTTAKASIGLGRNWIASEISSEYCEIGKERLSKARKLF